MSSREVGGWTEMLKRRRIPGNRSVSPEANICTDQAFALRSSGNDGSRKQRAVDGKAECGEKDSLGRLSGVPCTVR